MRVMPPCGHTGWTRQSGDVPAEYARMCGECITSYLITHGILFSDPQQTGRQMEAKAT